MHTIPFEKYEGLENDFVLIDSAKVAHLSPEPLAKKICHRKTGVGADGLILYETNPLTMHFYNADGSRAPMCGNGIRCLAKAFEKGHKGPFDIETDNGPVQVTCLSNGVKVDMGIPNFDTTAYHCSHSKPMLLQEPIHLEDTDLLITGLYMTTHHAVVFVSPSQWANRQWLERIGRALSTHPLFTKQINVNFALLKGPHQLLNRTYERGVGFTKACGSGACAVAVVAQKVLRSPLPFEVNMPGGTLWIESQNDHITMTGDARFVFSGHFTYTP